MNVLRVENVGKSFATYSSEIHRFLRWFGIPVKPEEEQWVLRNINFDIRSGEAIGIIGQNGAGKSTLLKIISGTLQPTEGNIRVAGRIAAILELGMGFDPNLTARQNIYHAAGLMGFNTADINKAIPDMEDFAEIGEYFDEPMRTYSSGMQMRIAFAVATAWRPDILIVDEALSVGDAYFQHKSFNRIREFQKQGTSLLIVSHDRTAIQSSCQRALLLENGVIIKDAEPEEVFDFYNALIAEKENSTVEVKKLDDGRAQTRSGTGEAGIEDVRLYSDKGEEIEFVGVGEEVELRIKVKVKRAIDSLVLGYAIKDRLGQTMYGTNTWHSQQVIENPHPGKVYEYAIRFPVNLGTGSYSVAVALHDSDSHLSKNYEWRDLACVFNVINKVKQEFCGCSWIEPNIVVKMK
jgi:lipopolysaccharide transport system ATP-binding protein